MEDGTNVERGPISLPDSTALVLFYHLCLRCDAKWFAKVNFGPCPRCGNANWSDERAVPPWKRDIAKDGGADRDPIE